MIALALIIILNLIREKGEFTNRVIRELVEFLTDKIIWLNQCDKQNQSEKQIECLKKKSELNDRYRFHFRSDFLYRKGENFLTSWWLILWNFWPIK